MKIILQGVLFLVAFAVTFCGAEEQQVINDLCRFRVAIIPHPNPELCFLYVQCQFVSGEVRECPVGTIFVQNELCVPGDRNTCQRDNQLPTPPPVPTAPTPPSTSTIPTLPPVPTTPVPPPIPTTPTPDTTPSIENICDEINTGILKDPRTCRGFVVCILGNPEFINCPNALPVFDARVQQCVAGNPVTCEIFGPTLPTTPLPPTFPPTPVTLPPQPTVPPQPTIPPVTIPPQPTIPPVPTQPTIPPVPTQPTWPPQPTIPPVTATPPPGSTSSPVAPPDGICRFNNLRFVADPSSCYRYFYCFFNVPLPGECAPDRIFSERLRGCVLGNQSTCTRDRVVEIEIIRP